MIDILKPRYNHCQYIAYISRFRKLPDLVKSQKQKLTVSTFQKLKTILNTDMQVNPLHQITMGENVTSTDPELLDKRIDLEMGSCFL